MHVCTDWMVPETWYEQMRDNVIVSGVFDVTFWTNVTFHETESKLKYSSAIGSYPLITDKLMSSPPITKCVIIVPVMKATW